MDRSADGGEVVLKASIDDVQVFEAQRPILLAIGYRMLGDLARAEDIVQDAWLRWQSRAEDPISPRAYLGTIVTRLCLNELDSARARREESRSDRLPEPVDLGAGGLARLESIEQVSMALMVALQRLTPAERAVLLLHDVLDLEHAQIAELVGKSEAACRKLLERAKTSVAEEKRMLVASREAHARLLEAFVKAGSAGDVGALASMLAEDAVMITDGGERGRTVRGLRNLREPLRGAKAIAEFVATASKRGGAVFEREIRELNGQPALVLRAPNGPSAAILLGVADGKIQRVFFHGDPARLGHLGLSASPARDRSRPRE